MVVLSEIWGGGLRLGWRFPLPVSQLQCKTFQCYMYLKNSFQFSEVLFGISSPVASADVPPRPGLNPREFENKTGQLLGFSVLSTGDNVLVCIAYTFVMALDC